MAFPNDLTIETRFQLNTTPDEIIKFTDTFDYVTAGIALTDVSGAFKVTSPTGTVFHETTLPTADIDHNVSLFIATIKLPNDATGVPIKGIYTVQYSVLIAGAVQPGTHVKTFTYNYQPETITPKVGITVDLICSKLTSTDNTSYPVTTTSQTLTHTIHPPDGIENSDPTYDDFTGSTKVLVYDKSITTKTWSSTISNILVLTIPATGGFFQHLIDLTIKGSAEKEIKDSINVCTLECNLRAIETRYTAALAKDSLSAEKLFHEQVGPATFYSNLFRNEIECGNFDKAEEYYNKVLLFTNSNKDCECADGTTPTIITPVCTGTGGTQTYVVDACNTNNALVVTSNVVASTTTFTVCFDDTIWTKINALTETAITSTGGTVTVTSATSGFTKTWNLEAVAVTAALLPFHNFSGIIDFNFTNKGAVPAISFRTNWSSVVGNKLKEPTTVNTETVFSSWSSKTNCFYLSLYKNATGGEFPKPQIELTEYTRVGQTLANISCRDKVPYKAQIIKLDTVNDRIYFRIVSESTGSAPSGGALQNSTDFISLKVTINA